MAHRYRLCGWLVESDIGLSGEIRVEEPLAKVDIHFKFGDVPESLADPVFSSQFLQVARTGLSLITIARTGRFLVKDGNEILIAPVNGATDSELRLFLLGTGLGMLCHQRGLLPIHASCVWTPQGAVAFCGHSGDGKSTLAAGLVSRGYPLLADDITVVDVHAPGGPLVWPALPGMRLWKKSLDAMALSEANLERNRAQLEKYVLPASQIGQFFKEPTKLHGIYVLGWNSKPGDASLAPVKTLDAMLLLKSHIYRGRPAKAYLGDQRLFKTVGALLKQCPLGRFMRDKDTGKLDATLDQITRQIS